MRRIRSIKPDFFLDEDLGELSPLHRVLFAGLWTLADRDGRLEDRPRRIKVEILPYDDCDVDALLSDLASKRCNGHRFIIRYRVNDQQIISITNFRKHQRITGRELDTPSQYPSPPENLDDGETMGKHQGNNGDKANVQEGKGRERKGKDTTFAQRQIEDPVSPPPPEDIFLTFPTDGKIKEWFLTKERVAEFKTLFPGLNVEIELRKDLRWIMDNPERRKTARGMPAHLMRWLAKAQNQGGQRNNALENDRIEAEERRRIAREYREAQRNEAIRKQKLEESAKVNQVD
jgi:hypothetical protein